MHGDAPCGLLAAAASLSRGGVAVGGGGRAHPCGSVPPTQPEKNRVTSSKGAPKIGCAPPRKRVARVPTVGTYTG